MLRYLAIVFTCLFILQISLNTLVFIQFKIQQEYILKEVCVQKNKSLNTCKGSCYLKTHLQKQDSQSDFSISYLKEKIDLYFNAFDLSTTFFYFCERVAYGNIFYAIHIQKNNDVFHPPA